MAASTSIEAVSIDFAKTNCRTSWVFPVTLFEVMIFKPSMVMNSLSKGVAQVLAMVEGLEPGLSTFTSIVG